MNRSIQAGVLAVLLCGSAIGFTSASSMSPANQDLPRTQPVSFNASLNPAVVAEKAPSEALRSFIAALADGDAKTVWKFASEDDQDAFETEDGVYGAFAETFPVFQTAKSVAVTGFQQQGDTPLLDLALTDRDGKRWTASVGMWQDDAGDWKVVSCDIEPVSASPLVALNGPSVR